MLRFWNRLHACHRFWRYRYRSERQEMSLMLQQDLAGTTVLDVGANRGAYSYWMHRAVASTGQVIAFEPQPELAAYLEDLKQTFGLKQLTIVNAGVSDRPGTLTFVRPRNHWGGGSFHLQPDHPNADVFDVSVLRLDDYLARRILPPVKFIKCDVQDHEIHVFRGARKTLLKHRPILLFEQTDRCVREGLIHSYLSGLGYSGYFLHQDRLTGVEELPELRASIPLPYLNFIYRFEERAALRRAA
ncbi:FkbM family methyltransferase [Anatilimnocola sp. NA78]|uniref:FkbM family methyltransferase n=1 Tax=Anatilimnocola sp. NA78 TaxID=3415683 RepID=UPI003CE5C56E